MDKKQIYFFIFGALSIIVLVLLIILYQYESLEIKINDEIYEDYYNIGNLTCIHALRGRWDNLFCYNEYINGRINHFPGSIFDIYMKTIDENDILPNIEKLQKAVDVYIEQNNVRSIDYIQDIMMDDVLCVHIRSGDFGNVEEKFIETIHTLSKDYRRVYILSGIHKDYRSGSKDNNMNNLSIDLEKIMNDDKYVFKNADADIDISIFRLCRNLLVHKEGFSLLGSILFQGNNLYITPLLNATTEKNRWSEYMGDRYIFIPLT